MKEQISCEIKFIAAGSNRHPSAADWDADSGILVFASDRNIAIWKPLDTRYKGIEVLLSGHSDVVNVVKLLCVEGYSLPLILSGSNDHDIGLWLPDGTRSSGYSLFELLTGHQKPINAIATLPCQNLFISGGADGELRVWRFSRALNGDAEVVCTQIIKLVPRFFPLAVSLHLIPNSVSAVLAVAGTYASVQIFVQDDVGFRLATTLAGHDSWIRALDFINESDGSSSDLLLASASQDKYVRLWRIQESGNPSGSQASAMDSALASMGHALSNKAHRLKAGERPYSITFEALLLGHEDWIFTAKWRRHGNKVRLLTASADSSLSIWELDPHSGVWVSTVRLGEVSMQKGATTATGSAGGYWIGLWSPNGDAVVSLGRTGSWRLWRYEHRLDQWKQDFAISGHTRDVTDVAWAKDGSYFVSTSLDQTTRQFALWNGESFEDTWHEISRPQIHGYDIICVDTISTGQLITGASEKLLRVFDMPRTVASYLSHVNNTTMPTRTAPTASIAVLGLSNKADDETTNGTVNGETPAEDVKGLEESVITKPPTEDRLARHLLWPETEKLYGHGYEISAVAASHDGTLVATACRASSIEHAVVRIFDTQKWLEIKPSLAAHSLTIHRIQFSPDDKFLLSVGRDRQFVIFSRSEANPNIYTLFTSNPKAHSRMIMDAAWAPLEAGRVFATAGRDKSINLWRMDKEEVNKFASTRVLHPVTAVAFFQSLIRGTLYFVFGLEDGSISVCGTHLAVSKVEVVSQEVYRWLLPSRAITRLALRPVPYAVNTNGSVDGDPSLAKTFDLAISSEDVSVRILRIFIE